MKYLRRHKRYNHRSRSGIVLLVTLVLLVVLATLAYTMSSRVAANRHRTNYMINYCIARYGCDSAIKYAVTSFSGMLVPAIVMRPNEPDFSDLFNLDQEEYEQFLAEWADWAAERKRIGTGDMMDFNSFGDVGSVNDTNSLFGLGDMLRDINDFNDTAWNMDANSNGPNYLEVRGPYGPPWPLIIKPVEFEIGGARVRIEIEDEDAKYPIAWMLLGEKESKRQIETGFKIFCEWMDVNESTISSLARELEDIGEIKTFSLEFKPIKITEKRPMKRTARSRSRRRGSRSYQTMRPVVKTIPASVHTTDFAKLLHSSLIDSEELARPTIVSDVRSESALKYMGMWGSGKVNINTAPRQVLEAAFAFGGDEVEITDAVIQRRRARPFKDIEDLRQSLLEHSVSIEKSKKYLTTVSSFFTIRVTAVSGSAKASAIAAIKKIGSKTERVAVIGG
ncbi:MAG: type II secretion system protein GspK [Planctomycetota bacterium]